MMMMMMSKSVDYSDMDTVRLLLMMIHIWGSDHDVEFSVGSSHVKKRILKSDFQNEKRSQYMNFYDLREGENL